MKREEARMLPPEKYRELLMAERAALLAKLGEKSPDVSDVGRVAEDDEGPLLHDQFISLRMKNLSYRRLKQIDAALDRLAAGEYGICAVCDEPISPKRLAAIPWAECCIACQERIGSEADSPDGSARAA